MDIFSKAPKSIATRLFLSATFWSVTLLIFAGIVLSALYRTSLEEAFDQRLGVYLRAIVADVATAGEDTRTEPGQLGEPQFELALSGWYWQITRLDVEKAEIKASRSLYAGKLPRLADLGVVPGIGGSRRGNATGPDGRNLRIVEREIDVGDEGIYLVQVAGTTDEMNYQFWQFLFAIFATLGLLAMALIATTALQVRYGLQPLRNLQEEVGAIRRGEGERINGTFAEDLSLLASELNLMIASNREILERARTQVGNLAHALKTPLSVIINETSNDTSPTADKAREQALIMRDQITFYLDRARAAARYGVVGASADVEPIVSALMRTFTKIFQDRPVHFSAELEGAVRFRGEQQDFEEMVGNLLDNAGKWSHSTVQLHVASCEPVQGADLNQSFLVIVDDDGPGLPQDLRDAALVRGGRLDESKPGSGLGLSIVVDLARLYGGGLDFSESPLGGLRAILRLPCV